MYVVIFLLYSVGFFEGILYSRIILTCSVYAIVEKAKSIDGGQWAKMLLGRRYLAGPQIIRES